MINDSLNDTHQIHRLYFESYQVYKQSFSLFPDTIDPKQLLLKTPEEPTPSQKQKSIKRKWETNISNRYLFINSIQNEPIQKKIKITDVEPIIYDFLTDEESEDNPVITFTSHYNSQIYQFKVQNNTLLKTPSSFFTFCFSMLNTENVKTYEINENPKHLLTIFTYLLDNNKGLSRLESEYNNFDELFELFNLCKKYCFDEIIEKIDSQFMGFYSPIKITEENVFEALKLVFYSSTNEQTFIILKNIFDHCLNYLISKGMIVQNRDIINDNLTKYLNKKIKISLKNEFFEFLKNFETDKILSIPFSVELTSLQLENCSYLEKLSILFPHCKSITTDILLVNDICPDTINRFKEIEQYHFIIRHKQSEIAIRKIKEKFPPFLNTIKDKICRFTIEKVKINKELLKLLLYFPKSLPFMVTHPGLSHFLEEEIIDKHLKIYQDASFFAKDLKIFSNLELRNNHLFMEVIRQNPQLEELNCFFYSSIDYREVFSLLRTLKHLRKLSICLVDHSELYREHFTYEAHNYFSDITTLKEIVIGNNMKSVCKTRPSYLIE